jgi:hypothetical protein
MGGASCQVDLELQQALCPNDADPAAIGPLVDHSILTAASADHPPLDRLQHLLSKENRDGSVTSKFQAYLGIEDVPESLEDAISLLGETLLELELVYVLQRGILNKDPNPAYVFHGRFGADYRFLVVPVQSRSIRPGPRAQSLSNFHVQCMRMPLDFFESPPCQECRGIHVRLVLTFFHAEERKRAFLQGKKLRKKDAFNPAIHCEWLSTLPLDWVVTAEANHGLVVHTPFGEIRWNDSEMRLQAGSRPVHALKPDARWRLAMSYLERHT